MENVKVKDFKSMRDVLTKDRVNGKVGHVVYTPLTKGSMLCLSAVLLTEDINTLIESMSEELPGYSELFNLTETVLMTKLETVGMSDYISKDIDKITAALICMGVDRPGKAAVAAVDIADFITQEIITCANEERDIPDDVPLSELIRLHTLHKDNHQFTLDKLLERVYPNGLYDDNTFIYIVDKILKPKRCTYGFLY